MVDSEIGKSRVTLSNVGGQYLKTYYFYYKQTKDIIESFVSIQNDTSITNYQNIGKSQRYGLNYYGSVRLKRTTLRLGFNIYNYITEDREINRTEINRKKAEDRERNRLEINKKKAEDR